MSKKKAKKHAKETSKPKKVLRRTGSKTLRVPPKPSNRQKPIGKQKQRKRVPDTARKTKHRIQKSVKPAIRKGRKPSKLKEFLRDIDYRKKPKRSRSILSEFPELDYLDNLEELLNDENAEEAEEQGNSKEMWFSKSHSAYPAIQKKAKKISSKKGKQVRGKERKRTAGKRKRVAVHRSTAKRDSGRSKKHHPISKPKRKR